MVALPATPSAELDVRPLAPALRPAQVIEAFRALGEGGSLVLVTDDPRPLLRELLASQRNRFNWSVLDSQVGCFRIELVTRDPHEERGVGEYLSWDHDRLDAIFRRACTLAAERRFSEVSGAFARFRCGLERHIEMEERVLFPLIEELTGTPAGPVVVMRFEHQAIQRLLGEIAEALEAKPHEPFEAIAGELEEVLRTHNMKEEGILYPAVDEALEGAPRREEVVTRLLTC